jgi:hypothetical protein
MLAALMKSAGAAMALSLISALPLRAQEAEAQTEQDDLTRPVTNLDIRYRFEEAASHYDKQELIFRNNWKIELSGPWRLALRFDLPLRAENKIDADNPGGDYGLGVGRLLGQAYLAEDLNPRWAYAFGGRITTPAASGTNFGSGNWDVDPLVGARVMLPEISEGSFFEPAFLYEQSVAQSFSGSHTSNLQAGPQLKIALPDKWFAELYPTTDIRWNFGAEKQGQTGRLFLPFDAQIGRTIGSALQASLEVGVPIIRDYPVYKLKIVTRVAYQF